MTLSASFSARFGIGLWHPAPAAESANIRVRFTPPATRFESEAEVSAKLYAFEDQPTPNVVTDKRPGNIGPLDAPEEMRGPWRWHSYERERNARYLWSRKGAA